MLALKPRGWLSVSCSTAALARDHYAGQRDPNAFRIPALAARQVSPRSRSRSFAVGSVVGLIAVEGDKFIVAAGRKLDCGDRRPELGFR